MLSHQIEQEMGGMSPTEREQHLLTYIDYFVPSMEPATLIMEHWNLALTAIEGRYVHLMTAPSGRIVSAESFLNRAHRDRGGKFADRTNVASNIKRLRRKIRENGIGLEINTYYQLGYSLVITDPSLTPPWGSQGTIKVHLPTGLSLVEPIRA